MIYGSGHNTKRLSNYAKKIFEANKVATKQNLENLSYAKARIDDLFNAPAALGKWLGGKGGGGVAGEELGEQVGALGVNTVFPEGRLPELAPMLLPGSPLWHISTRPLKSFHEDFDIGRNYGNYTWFGRDLRTALDPHTGAQMLPEDARFVHKIRVTEPIRYLSPADVTQRVSGIENLSLAQRNAFREALYSRQMPPFKADEDVFHYLDVVRARDLDQILQNLGYEGISTSAAYRVPDTPPWNPFYREGSEIDRSLALMPEAAARKLKISRVRPIPPQDPELGAAYLESLRAPR